MSGKKTRPELPLRRFSWDGLSFRVPEDWNLSEYHFGKRMASVRLEDDVSLRLECEWTRSPRALDADEVIERHAKSTRELSSLAEEVLRVEPAPPGWSAFLYSMPMKKHFIMAFWLAPDGRVCCFFKLHFEKPGGLQEPRLILDTVMNTFQFLQTGWIPWEIYDMSFSLNRDFWLANTSFKAGRKLLVFQWRLRRLYLWQFSLADILLKEKSLSDWAADYLNRFREIRGPHFFPVSETVIGAERRWRFPFVNYDEIGRQCFRYKAGCVRLPEKNAIILSVFNYRKPDDLKKLSESLVASTNALVEEMVRPEPPS